MTHHYVSFILNFDETKILHERLLKTWQRKKGIRTYVIMSNLRPKGLLAKLRGALAKLNRNHELEQRMRRVSQCTLYR